MQFLDHPILCRRFRSCVLSGSGFSALAVAALLSCTIGASAGPHPSYESLSALLEREAKTAGVPPELAEAVTHVESDFNPDTVGQDGEIGLMQVLPSTARMMGFSGSLAELAVPETNIRYGVAYLARAWRLASGDICTATMKYRAGHGETRFSYLSVDYCLRVRARLSARGYAVSGVVPVATFGELPGRRRSLMFAGTVGGPDLSMLNAALAKTVEQAAFMKASAKSR